MKFKALKTMMNVVEKNAKDFGIEDIDEYLIEVPSSYGYDMERRCININHEIKCITIEINNKEGC